MNTGQFIIKYRWAIIIISILITGFFGLQIYKAEINPDLETYIPREMASRVNTDEIEKIFGGDELLIVLLETNDVLCEETLERLKDIRKELRKSEEFGKVMSLFDVKNIRSEEGALLVDPAIKSIPETEESREQLRQQLRDNQMAYGVVVSEDFRLTAIILSVAPGYVDDELIEKVNQVIREVPGDEKVYIGGMPFIKASLSSEVAREFKILMIIGISIMLVMLYFFFKEIRGVLMPILVVILSVLFTMGMIPLLGWQMSIITLLLPIMMIAIANNYGIHLMARYQEINTPGNKETIRQISEKLFTRMRAPILMAGLTTIAGFLSLLSHKMIPAKQLGFLAGIGIVFALILSLFFIPALLSLLGKSKPVLKETGKSGQFLDRILHYFSGIIIARPGRILIFSILFAIISGLGIILLKVDTDLESFFPEKHEVRISAELINKIFGGSQNISILVEGDILDPEILRRIDHYENELKAHPAVGNVTSIAMVMHEISKAMNDPGEPWYDAVPSTREAAAQYLELYSMSGDMSDLEKLIDFNYEKTQILVRINNGSNASLKSVLSKIQELTTGDSNVTRIGGYGLVAAELGEVVVKGQISSLAIALIIIMIIVAVFFRSAEAGIIATIPIGLSIIILFGWMGYLGVKLDVATALLSSIMIGVGVDYTIHFLWRYREERFHGLKSTAAVRKTLITTGRGITFNAFSVIIGFAALPFSVFPPLKFFGYLVMISIVACLIGALIIIPAAVLIFRPRFLEPVRHSKKKYQSIRFRYVTRMFRLALKSIFIGWHKSYPLGIKQHSSDGLAPSDE